MARVRALEAERTDYLSHRQRVPGRLTGDIAEYGCQAEEYRTQGNRMQNQALRESAQSEKKGVEMSGFVRCVLHIVSPKLGPSTTQTRLTHSISR
jgi:hypothetical protein